MRGYSHGRRKNVAVTGRRVVKDTERRAKSSGSLSTVAVGALRGFRGFGYGQVSKRVTAALLRRFGLGSGAVVISSLHMKALLAAIF